MGGSEPKPRGPRSLSRLWEPRGPAVRLLREWDAELEQDG